MQQLLASINAVMDTGQPTHCAVHRVIMSGLELIAGSGCCGREPAPLSGAEPQLRSWLPLLGLPLLPVSTPTFSASTGSFLRCGRIKDTLGLPLLAQSTTNSHVGAQVQMPM